MVKNILPILIFLFIIDTQAQSKCASLLLKGESNPITRSKIDIVELAVKDLNTYRQWERRSKSFSDLDFPTENVNPIRKVLQVLKKEFIAKSDAPGYFRAIHKDLIEEAELLLSQNAPYLETLRFHQRAAIILSAFEGRHPENPEYKEPDTYASETALRKSLEWEDSEILRKVHDFAAGKAFFWVLSNKSGYSEKTFNASHHIPLYKIEYTVDVRTGDNNEKQSPKKFSSHDYFHAEREQLHQAQGSRLYAVSQAHKIEAFLRLINSLGDVHKEEAIHRALFEVTHEMNLDVRKVRNVARRIADQGFVYEETSPLSKIEITAYRWLAEHYPIRF